MRKTGYIHYHGGSRTGRTPQVCNYMWHLLAQTSIQEVPLMAAYLQHLFIVSDLGKGNVGMGG